MCLSCLQEEEGGGEQKKEQFFHEIGFENWGFKGEEGKERRRKSGIYKKKTTSPKHLSASLIFSSEDSCELHFKNLRLLRSLRLTLLSILMNDSAVLHPSEPSIQ